MKDVEKIPEEFGGMKDIIPDQRTGMSEDRRARKTGPGVPEHPERKGKSEDYKTTWKKTRREEFCKDSKKYRELNGAGMKSPGPGCTGTKAGAIVTRLDNTGGRGRKGGLHHKPGDVEKIDTGGFRAGGTGRRPEHRMMTSGEISEGSEEKIRRRCGGPGAEPGESQKVVPMETTRKDESKIRNRIHEWNRRAPKCSGRPKCPDEVPKAGGRTGGVRRRPERSEEDGNVVVEVGTTRKEWRKSGIKSAGGAGGLRGEEDHPCKDDRTNHREPSVKDWKGVKHSTGTRAYLMLVKPVTFAKVAYRIRKGPEQPEREMPECKMPERQRWSHGRKPAEKSFRAKRCRSEIAGTGMIRSQAGAMWLRVYSKESVDPVGRNRRSRKKGRTTPKIQGMSENDSGGSGTGLIGSQNEKLPEEAQGLPGGTRRSGNVVPELETTGKEEEKIGMEYGDGAGELRRTVENHPSRSGSVEILYGDNGLSDAGQDPGGSGTTGTRDAGVQDAGKATVVTWKKTRRKGFIKTPKNTEAWEVVTNTRRWASPKRSATYNCNRRSERSEKLGSRGSDRENTKGEREAKSGWSENSGGGGGDVQRNPHVRTEVRRDGHRSPKISIEGSGPGEDVERTLAKAHRRDRSDRIGSGVPFRNRKANTGSD
ncbi:hypothetical protein B0H11DRAFT_1920769 [Mycena galericulata]|nr:hypothetical protein B0H11DRAFT_1920769 [Mycena galericulata]